MYHHAATRSRGRLLVLCMSWGAGIFLFTFGAWVFVEVCGLARALAVVFPVSMEPTVRVNCATTMMLSIPPLALAAIAGMIHRSWKIALGSLVVYLIPICAFFALVLPSWFF
jgi:uncharacterized PurR-regulated membrane protein YhhQ (DUF165 family)